MYAGTPPLVEVTASDVTAALTELPLFDNGMYMPPLTAIPTSELVVVPVIADAIVNDVPGVTLATGKVRPLSFAPNTVVQDANVTFWPTLKLFAAVTVITPPEADNPVTKALELP
jgi:hypothetical protein